jgi:hypothetical protein
VNAIGPVSVMCYGSIIGSLSKLGLKMTDVTCDCGAIYRETSVKFPLRDKDKFNCERCGTLIKEWNATTSYSYELLSPAEPKKP